MSSAPIDATAMQPANLMKILVATDNHLGYGEKDSIRGNDSFVTFEEILQHAVRNEVDFILLGGDLFHDAKPSPNTLQRCMRLLRTYTLGDKPIALEFLSDQSLNFGAALNQTVNYEDPNMNIAYPVFSIHGNHDDPSGFGRLSALDLLATNGLVNYFGKWTDLTKISVAPILLRKGTTQLALYGLSYIQDCRLARLFQETKVVLERPYGGGADGDGVGDSSTATPSDGNDGGGGGDWFNVMVLHQNRADRGLKNYLPEHILPEFVDLFVWGHEHDCRIVPERNTQHKFYVTQPGSSVATSLAEGEALPKHCGLLLVHGTEFKLEPIALRTVRPFVFETLLLAQHADELRLLESDASQRIQDFIAARIEHMIKDAAEQLTGHPQQPKVPLIRLRVVYDAEVQMFNTIRFGNLYHGRVANPNDMILFKKQAKRGATDVKPLDKAAMQHVFGQRDDLDEQTRVEDIVNRYFEEADASAKLEVLYPRSMNEMCRRLVDNDDDDAVECILKIHQDRACEFLNNRMPAKEDVLVHLAELELEQDKIFETAMQMLDSRGGSNNSNNATTTATANAASASANWSPDKTTTTSSRAPAAVAAPAARGRGRGRGRGAAANTTTTSSRANAAAGRKAASNALNISVTSAASVAASTKPQQPSIVSSFASQSTRQSQRNPIAARSNQRTAKFTQYISDSDSN